MTEPCCEGRPSCRFRGPLIAAWALQGALLVATGAAAATASLAERVCGELLAAWAASFMLVLAGLLTGAGLARHGGFPRWGLTFILAVSAAAQAPLVLAPPALSDDAHRYLLDGRLACAGVNPHAHAPSDPVVAAVAGPELSRVGHPDVRTVYPPLAELLFAAVVMLGGGMVGLKLVAAASGLALAFLVGWLLPRSGRHRALLVAWHPLVLLETAGSGHVDACAVALAVAAVATLVLGPARPRRAALLLVLGAWVKLLPVAGAACLAPVLRRRLAAACAVAGAAAVLPALLGPAEVGESGLVAYARHWEFNGAAYPLVRGAVEALDVKALLDRSVAPLAGDGAAAVIRWTGPETTTRAVLLALWLASLVVGARRTVRLGPVAGLSVPCAAFVLLSPTLHPWYLLWVLPFVALRPSAAWLYWTGAVGLAHASALAAGGGDWTELAWPRWLQLAPFALLWLAERRWRTAAGDRRWHAACCSPRREGSLPHGSKVARSLPGASGPRGRTRPEARSPPA